MVYTGFVIKPLSIVVRTAAVLLVLLVGVCRAPDSHGSGPGGHGCHPGNLIPNCGMDQFAPTAQGQAPLGWTPFVISGGLAMDPSPDTYWGAPSLRMWSDGGVFVAGIWTQVGGLTPGATYRVSMGWGAPTEPDAFGRRLGIDPTGGIDPNSPSIAWGPMLRGPGKVLNDSNPGYPNIDVTAVARGTTVTVFVWVDHNYSTGPNQIFIDAVSLYQDAAAVVAPPTDTPPPAQAKAVAAAPTRRIATVTLGPTATSTATNTATSTAAPTSTPTPTDTPSPTVTPTPQDTATPTVTPSSTLPPRPRATAVLVVSVPVSTASAPLQELLFGGVGALLGAGLLSARVAVKRRNGSLRGETENHGADHN